MVIQLLTKLGVSGGALTGSMLGFKPEWINDKKIGETTAEAGPNINLDEIKTLVDVYIFEKQKGCSFAFINSWGSKEVNRAEEFIDKAVKQTAHINTEKNEWTKLIIEAVKKQENKEKCSDNKFLVFSSPNPSEKNLDLRVPE